MTVARNHRGSPPQAGDIVGAEVHRVPARALGREGHRIGGKDEHVIAGVDGGGVAAETGPDEQPLVARKVPQQPRQQLGRELARTHRRTLPPKGGDS